MKPKRERNLKKEKNKWFAENELLEYLGISKEEFSEKLSIFTEGLHFTKENPSDPTSKTLWRIDLIDQLLCIPIAPLEREAMEKAINNNIICKK
tara:strand:- start:176 stop:457 length:282 start_codon:yes stop_codon:yes gene_type:complete